MYRGPRCNKQRFGESFSSQSVAMRARAPAWRGVVLAAVLAAPRGARGLRSLARVVRPRGAATRVWAGASPTARRRFHPRNRHPGRYDFERLTQFYPALGELLVENPVTKAPTLDWSLREAVLALNAAILVADYGVRGLEDCLPEGYLVPGVPSRAEYLHIVGDLLTPPSREAPPRGPQVKGLDVGTGASCIYPLLGRADYGWAFVATDIDQRALEAAREMVARNADAAGVGDARRSPPAPIHVLPSPGPIFCEDTLVRSVAGVTFTMCNPPFHESADQAARLNDRKRRGLQKNKAKKMKELAAAAARGEGGGQGGDVVLPVFPDDALQYGGRPHELHCPGGESRFVGQMVRESRRWHDIAAATPGAPEPPVWFTSLVSKGGRIGPLEQAADRHGAAIVKICEFATSQKVSRVLAWSFLDDDQRHARLEALYQGAD